MKALIERLDAIPCMETRQTIIMQEETKAVARDFLICAIGIGQQFTNENGLVLLRAYSLIETHELIFPTANALFTNAINAAKELFGAVREIVTSPNPNTTGFNDLLENYTHHKQVLEGDSKEAKLANAIMRLDACVFKMQTITEDTEMFRVFDRCRVILERTVAHLSSQ